MARPKYARIGIVLVDVPGPTRWPCRVGARYETDLGLNAPGGTWFSQQPGSKLWMRRRMSPGPLLDRDAARRGPLDARDDRKAATAGETRHLLRAKAEGWTTADFKGTGALARRSVERLVARRSSGSTSARTPSSVIRRLPRDLRTG